MNQASKILTTHVGSLIRPPELATFYRAKQDKKPIDETAFEARLEASVVDVVRHQAEIGIDIVSDGEYGKSNWWRYIIERFTGIEQRAPMPGEDVEAIAKMARGKDRERFAEFYAEYDRLNEISGPMAGWAVTGPITYKGQAVLQRDIRNFKAALQRVNGGTTGFMPVVAPASVAPGHRDMHYGNEEKCMFAIADALHEEYKGIIDAGLNIQIDDAWMTIMYDRMVPPGSFADYRKWAQLRIDALNHALRGLPEDRTRYHVCWGSWAGPHTSDVPLKQIVDLILSVRAGGYSLEAANPRHEHEWRVWETVKLPPGKKLYTGVISHATNVVEHPELVAERITRLARLIGPESLVASTDCGFAQGALYQRVHPSIMWAKLESLVEGAKLATQQLA
jgi:5-methyltetrahydropteroyltriglutamate--homocysteine methyltransferase